MIHAGELKHRILIEETVQTKDSIGGFTTEWRPLGTAWAVIKGQGLQQRLYVGEMQRKQQIVFVIRQCQVFDLSVVAFNNLRIAHRGQYFACINPAQANYGLDFYELAAEARGGVWS